MKGIRAAVVTLSDKGSRGERVDESGRLVAEILENKGIGITSYEILPDECDRIEGHLERLIREESVDLILTTGGTGVSPRDVTPEATLAVGEKRLWGIEEEMRRVSTSKTPHGMLSRGVAVTAGRTLILNLPGSPRGVRENLEAVIEAIPHAIGILTGRSVECGKADHRKGH